MQLLPQLLDLPGGLAAESAGVVRICQLVEGLPLGIELAAAWVRLLSCQAIAQEIEQRLDFLAARLRNLPERQRSLRAVFEHSWKLLTAEGGQEAEIKPAMESLWLFYKMQGWVLEGEGCQRIGSGRADEAGDHPLTVGPSLSR